MIESEYLMVFYAVILTLVAHISARFLSKKLTVVPTVITAMILVLLFLFIFQWDYKDYYETAKPLFDHLLGYVVVLLAIPIASMDFSGLPIKKLLKIVCIGTLLGALLPMILATAIALNQDIILSFSARSVTAPVGLSIAKIIHAPLAMTNLIIVISGLAGAGLGRTILKNISDDRAKGLAMGMMSHAFGTVEAWQISHVAGRYAAFGLAINGLITAVWVPVFINYMMKQ